MGVVDDRRPVAVFGCPLYNHAEHVESAIGSLLSQTRRDFVILLLDDGSDDRTPELGARLAERDERVRFASSPERLGLARAWRAVFEWARRDFPDARYFAWGSDHDLWDPLWLERMVAALESHPEAVLAYPITQRIEADGTPYKQTGEFDTISLAGRAERVRAVQRRAPAGSLVYGLAVAEALERAGGFRRVPEPDRLVLMELALRGPFVQVPEVLWQRRYVKIATRARQNAAIFLDSRTPARYAPPWLVHALVFAQAYGLRGAGRPAAGRLAGAWLAARIGLGGAARQLESRRRQARLPRKRLERRVQRWWRATKRRYRHNWRTKKRRLRRKVLTFGGRVLRRLGLRRQKPQ